MRNVTITLDEEVARWVRIRAAEQEMSMSRLVGEMLRDKMLAERGYENAMREYLAQRTRKLKKPEARYPKRSELHGR
jgi:plasmid stability protein